MALVTYDESVEGKGIRCSGRRRDWTVLVEVTIQGVKIRGTITCYVDTEELAKELACRSILNSLRRAGVWADTDEIDEPYEVEVEGPKDKKTGKPTKKKETKFKKVTQYHAPYWDHVKAIDIIESGYRKLTYSTEELEANAQENAGTSMPRTKRRTTSEVALNKRKKKQTSLAKKEEQVEKKKKVEVNKQSKDELLRAVEAYFTGDDAKIIKVAASELNQTYQRVRYALFQIKDKGYNGVEYDLVQTEVDGSKAFRLVKKGK